MRMNHWFQRFSRSMNHILKYISLGIFFLILSYFFSSDFFKYHQNQQTQKVILENSHQKLQQLSNSSIAQVEGLEIFKTPDTWVIESIVKKIQKAQKNIYLNCYIFTEKKIRSALIDAQKRGVEVKVILEKNIFNAPNLNKKTFDMLQEAWVGVVWSSWKNFSLNHAKYILIDDQWVISTGNYSYSNFHDKRDIFMFLKDTKILKDLRDMFLWDYQGEKKFFYEDNTLLSSFDARKKMEYLLGSAQKSISMYVPYLRDTNLTKLLLKKISSWTTVTIVSGNNNTQDSNLQELKDAWAEVRYISMEVHAKAFLVDDSILYVGSANFSSSSLDQNREVGLLISNPDIIKKFWSFIGSE